MQVGGGMQMATGNAADELWPGALFRRPRTPRQLVASSLRPSSAAPRTMHYGLISGRGGLR